MRRLAVLALAGLCLAGCKREDMYTQGRSQTWDRDSFFSNNRAMRQPVAGTVARNPANLPVPQPAVIDVAMLERGHERFDIFCAPCHGRAGDGRGMIVQRGFPQPPSFHEPRLQQAAASVFLDAIVNGYGVMYSYADRVPPADRWAIIAYIRALQVSQHAPATALSAGDREHLASAPTEAVSGASGPQNPQDSGREPGGHDDETRGARS